MNFGPRTPKIGPSFYPPSVNSAFCNIGTFRTRRPANKTQSNFAKRYGVDSANKLPQKFGVIALEKWGPKNYTFGRFWRLWDLMANAFVTKHAIDNRGTALKATKGSLQSTTNSWTLVHKRRKKDRVLPTLRKFCILFHCETSHTEVIQRNSTQLYQTVGVNRADKYRKMGVLRLKKFGPPKLSTFRFPDNFET